MNRIPHKKRFSLLAIVLLAFVAGGVAFSVPEVRAIFRPIEEKIISPPAIASNIPLTGDITSPYAFADVAEATSPAVVYIMSVKATESQYITPTDPFFRFFFGDQPFETPGRETYGEGTGFIISQDGYILTNDHVVNGATEIQVTIQGFDEPFIAELVGSDYDLDLAVLKVKAPDSLPALPLGDSNASRVGEWVLAIGNPWGKDFDHTVTVGTLSAKGRQIQIVDTEKNKMRNYPDLMQTDAAINPGNSGGPLINIKGEVIGINTAVNSQAQGIGFAIPINTAKKVVDQLIEYGKVIRPYLGIIYYSQISPAQAEQLGLPDSNGVLVGEVIKDGPAHKAGMKPLDYIRTINGTKLESTGDFEEVLSKAKVGDKMVVDVIRDGKYVSLTITLGERPADE
ncbi:MAG: trypsin-like peptidase domain-containing protein [Firmicutes bacterium]|nr:trypsin-like peptidase domain-containing protein [Bacillota bacterium]